MTSGRSDPAASLVSPAQAAHHSWIVVAAALVAGGLILGLIVGRWWALTAAAAVWLVIALTGDFDGPAWAVGIGMALLAALGVAIGVLIRSIAKPSRGHRAK
jgi:hypothetical protein